MTEGLLRPRKPFPISRPFFQLLTTRRGLKCERHPPLTPPAAPAVRHPHAESLPGIPGKKATSKVRSVFMCESRPSNRRSGGRPVSDAAQRTVPPVLTARPSGRRSPRRHAGGSTRAHTTEIQLRPGTVSLLLTCVRLGAIKQLSHFSQNGPFPCYSAACWVFTTPTSDWTKRREGIKWIKIKQEDKHTLNNVSRDINAHSASTSLFLCLIYHHVHQASHFFLKLIIASSW